jgi:hypothetical protein
MRENEMYVVRKISTGMRGENRDAVAQGASSGLLRRGEEAQRGSGSTRPPGRDKSAMGHALTCAGWFWVGYASLLVLIVLEMWK